MSYARQSEGVVKSSGSSAPVASASDKGKPLLSISEERRAPDADEAKRYADEQKRAQGALRDIQKHVAEIQKQTQQLNAPNASAIVGKTRSKAQEALKAAQGIAAEATVLLRGIVVDAKGISGMEQKLRQAKQQKLTESLNQSTATLQAAMKAYERREEEVQAAAERLAAMQASAASSASSPPVRRGWGRSDAHHSRPDSEAPGVELEEGVRGPALKEMLVSEAEIDMHGQLVEEFTTEVTSLEDDVRSLANTMRQVAGMVQDQGEVLDNIESNMGSAAEQSSGATEQLVLAADNQRRGNKRIWWILLFAVVLAIILIGALISRG